MSNKENFDFSVESKVLFSTCSLAAVKTLLANIIMKFHLAQNETRTYSLYAIIYRI